MEKSQIWDLLEVKLNRSCGQTEMSSGKDSGGKRGFKSGSRQWKRLEQEQFKVRMWGGSSLMWCS